MLTHDQAYHVLLAACHTPLQLYLPSKLSGVALPYMNALMNLSFSQTTIAQKLETRDAWTIVLNQHWDLLHLVGGANVGIQKSTPFLMLRLNQDDDAYCYCRHAMSVDWSDSSEEDFETATIRSNSNKDRFRDVVADLGGEQNWNRNFSDISFVVALVVIKMRLVAVYESMLEEIHAFGATSGSHMVDPDGQAEVRRSLLGPAEDEFKLADQRRQLSFLLHAVHARNASIVPAFLNPEPMLSVPTVDEPPPGSPLEARVVWNFAMELWHDIPGANRFLRTFFGTATPWYPT